MKAALVAAERGHEVNLLEKEEFQGRSYDSMISHTTLVFSVTFF